MATTFSAREYQTPRHIDREADPRVHTRPGTTFLTIALPTLLYAFVFGCNDKSGCPAPALFRLKTVSAETLKRDLGWPAEGIWGLASWDATFWTLAYYLFSAVLQRVLPAQEVDGVVLANGSRLKYRMNGAYGMGGTHSQPFTWC
jgi:delta14-sterol reductase